jgi:hypothetical protein
MGLSVFAHAWWHLLIALFMMYLPPLFPTLIRTTGAGFCFDIGRIAAAFGTVFFGLPSKTGDGRLALLYAGFLFLPAAALATVLPPPLLRPARAAGAGGERCGARPMP